VHQVLIYPATDLTMQSLSLVTNADAPILDRRAVEVFREHYLGTDALHTAPHDPLAYPLLAAATPSRCTKPGWQCGTPTELHRADRGVQRNRAARPSRVLVMPAALVAGIFISSRTLGALAVV